MTDYSGGLSLIGGIVIILLVVWAILWFMVPFYIRKMKNDMSDLSNNVTGLRKDIATIRDQVTKGKIQMVWWQPDQDENKS